jgi:3-oxoacyl-[acyl-carrier protein] reductase
MDLLIKGKVALVGASGNGLGLASACRLAMEGCHVAVCDLNAPGLEAAKTAVLAAGKGAVRVMARHADLTKPGDIEALVANVRQELGSIDILVTNAGGPPPNMFDQATDDKWQKGFELTFLSAVRLIRAVLPDMKARKWGRIINFTSRALREPIDNLMISNAVRLAVGGMAKTLASEVAPFGITVNNVCPGPTSTDRAIELAAARAAKKGISTDEELALTAGRIPRGRLAMPEEPAAAVAYLSSELAGHITGISLLIDGGETKAL